MTTPSPRRAAKLGVTRLEDRITPVIRAYDIAQVPDTGAFDGVARFNNASAALLSNARFTLTAAHTGTAGSNAPTRFELDGPGNTQRVINTPGAGFVPHPSYVLGVGDFDIGLMPLAELGPLTAERWDLFTGTDELNRVGRLVGFGGTGTGTSGHSTDVRSGAATETNLNYEVVRFTVTGSPTGGTFTIRNAANPVGQTVPSDVTAAELKTALDALFGPTNTQVRLVGDTDFNGTVDDFNNPRRGSFEAVFSNTTSPTHQLPDLTVTDNLTGGSNPGVVVQKLLDGGSARVRTTGTQGVSVTSPNGMLLFTDFDNGSNAFDTLNDGTGQGANEGHGTWGDSGSPLFIGGKIAGVLEGLYPSVNGLSSKFGADGKDGTGDWGEIDSWARVSSHLQFLQGQMDDPFALVLNMANQLPGGDGAADHVAVKTVGGQLRIYFGGKQVYAESAGLITSVTIRGSTDAETFDLTDLDLAVPVTVTAGGGNDTVVVGGKTASSIGIDGQAGADGVQIRGVQAGTTATVNGGDGDTVTVGDGDLDTNIRGDVTVAGNGKGVSVVLFDALDKGADSYRLAADRLTKPTLAGAVEFPGVRNVYLYANGSANHVTVAGTAAGTEYYVSAGGGKDVVEVGDGNAAAQIDGDLTVNAGSDADTLVFNAEDGPAGGVYTVHGGSVTATGMTGGVTYSSFARVVVRGTDGADEFRQGNVPSGTAVSLDGRGGKDRLLLNAVPDNKLTFHGGPEFDTAVLVGTNGVDDITIEGNTLDFVGGGSVTLFAVEDASIDTKAGIDQLGFAGRAGVDEDARLFGDAAANAGLWQNGSFAVRFKNTELTTAAGNPGDADTLTFHGTAADDWFQADLAAAGNLFDPLVRLTTSGGQHRLTLVDATGFDRTTLAGGEGADLFTVAVASVPPVGRNLHVDGGGNGTTRDADRLRVVYDAKPGPTVTDTPTGPQAGTVRVRYSPRRKFDVTYERMELVEPTPLP